MSRDDYDDDYDRPRRRRRRDDDDDYYDDAPRIARRGGEESIGLSVASMVCGIISALIFCFWPVSVPLAILAIIFGAIGMSKGGKGMGIAGMVCGFVAIALLLIFFLIALASPGWNMGPVFWNR